MVQYIHSIHVVWLEGYKS